MRYKGQPTRGICEQRPQVDIRRLARDGHLDPHGYLYGKRVPAVKTTNPDDIAVKCDFYSVTLWHGCDEEETEQAIKVVRTACNYGRDRAWFECPSCRRRCAIVYFGGSWACRKCWRLKYQSQRNPNTAWTNCERIKRIRRRLGASPTDAIWSPVPPRPLRMRFATYDRLKAAYEAAQQAQICTDAPPRHHWR